MGVTDRILDATSRLGTPWLHLAAGGLAYGETAVLLDLIVPGEVGMVVVGASAAAGDVALAPVIAAAALGATLGDSTSYALGRFAGRPLLCRWEPIRRRMSPKIERAEAQFARRGGALVFLARFVGALRAVAPLVAGIEHMPFRRFLAWNVAASIVWASLTVSLGYVFGDEIASFVDRGGWVLSVVIVLGMGAWWLRRRRRGRGAHMTDASSAGPQGTDAHEDEPTPVTPGPIAATPSSTGVVAGDGDEPDETGDDGRD